MNNEIQNTEIKEEDKIEFLKSMFSTLEIDEQAKFTQWCHEEVEKGGAKYLGKKIEEVNQKMNNFIAKAYDQTKKGAKFVYEKSNQVLAKDEDRMKNNSMPKSDGKPSFFD